MSYTVAQVTSPRNEITHWAPHDSEALGHSPTDVISALRNGNNHVRSLIYHFVNPSSTTEYNELIRMVSDPHNHLEEITLDFSDASYIPYAALSTLVYSLVGIESKIASITLMRITAPPNCSLMRDLSRIVNGFGNSIRRVRLMGCRVSPDGIALLQRACGRPNCVVEELWICDSMVCSKTPTVRVRASDKSHAKYCVRVCDESHSCNPNADV